MAERPTPHGLVLSALIVLSSLPSDCLEDCFLHPARPGRLGWASDGVGHEDNDAHDDVDDDDDDSSSLVQVTGRYPSLVAPPSSAGAAAARRNSSEREGLWDDLREFLVEAMDFGSPASSSGGYDPHPSIILARLRAAAASASRRRSASRSATHAGNGNGNTPDELLLTYLGGTLFRSVDTLHDLVYDVLAQCTQKPTADRNHNGNNNAAASKEVTVDPTSRMGLYVRRRVLGFDMLCFESTARLWEECRRWVDDGWDWIEQRQRYEEEEDYGQGLQSQAQAHSCWPPTSAQLSSHLYDYCTNNNDNHTANTDGGGTTTPTPAPAVYERTMEHLARISRDDPTLPPLHYAKFLACLKNGERIGAVESLHRYFDYAVIAGRREAVGRLLDYHCDGAGGGGGGGIGGGGAGGNNDARQQQQQQRQQGGANGGASAGGADQADPLKPLSRYAPLLLTMLHHSHGQHGLARKAAEEAIRVGQQCSDSGAVTLALGWLALLDQELGGAVGGGGRGEHNASVDMGDGVGGNAGGPSASEQLWTLARTRATRHGPVNLCSRSSLALAQGRAQNAVGPHPGSSGSSNGTNPSSSARGTTGGTSTLGAAWLDLASSTTSAIPSAAASTGPPHLAGVQSNQADNSAADTTAPSDRPTSILPLSNADSDQSRDGIDQIVRLQHLIGSRIWDSVGRGDMASLECKAATASDTPGESSLNNLSAKELALAATKIAMSAMQGTVGIEKVRPDDNSPPSTAHKRCLDELVNLRSTHPQIDRDSWSNAVVLVLHDWAIRSQTNTPLSSSIRLHLRCGMAASSATPGLNSLSVGQIESTLLFLESQATALTSQGRFEDAMSVTRKAIDLAAWHNLHVHHANSLLRLAKIRLACIPSQPTLVLPSLLECLSICEQHIIDPIHAAAVGTLGKVHLLMGNHTLAQSVLSAAMPTIVQAAPGDTVADALVTLAKCDLALLQDGRRNGLQAQQQQQREKRLLNRATSLLSEAEQVAQDMSDRSMLREIVYIMAHVGNLRGDVSARDAASKRFVDLSTNAESLGCICVQ